MKKLLLPLFIVTQFVFADPPEWEFNPAEFEHQMAINALVDNGSEILGDGADMLAAFSEDGCVWGLGVPLEVPFGPYTGEIIWELTIFGDEWESGIEYSFQYYDDSADHDFSINEEIQYMNNELLGNLFDPIFFTLVEAECEYDECGVCDGPGAVYECGCSDVDEGACDCDGNILDGCGVCGGDADGTDCNGDGVDDVCEDEYDTGFDSGFFEGLG